MPAEDAQPDSFCTCLAARPESDRKSRRRQDTEVHESGNGGGNVCDAYN